MKKFLAICMIFMLILSFAACDKETGGEASLTPTLTPTVSPSDNAAINTLDADTTNTPEATVTTTPSLAATNTLVPVNSTPSHQHSWGDWKKETKAYIGKNGTDKRVCSTCQATETRPRTQNATYNSLYCFSYQYALSGTNNVSAFNMVCYACSEFTEYAYKPTPTATVIAELKKHFNIDAQMETELLAAMKTFNYDAQKDEIILEGMAESGDFILKGYKHLGGNRYETYYSFSGFDIFEPRNDLYKVEIEYNRAEGRPNKFIFSVLIESLPSDMTVCPAGESYEYK